MLEDYLALGPIWYVIFLLSLTCHEAAHALAAKLGGDLTAFAGGQVTLDPIPHMRREPIGTIVVPIVSFLLNEGRWMMGWASAPYDPLWQLRHPKRAAWMALAGPLANFALVLIAALAIRVGILAGFFEIPSSLSFTRMVGATGGGVAEVLATVVSILFCLNLLLMAFNLMPVPPLDGITVLGLFMSVPLARRVAEWSRSPLAFAGLIVAWKMFDYVFPPIFRLAIGILYPEVRYGW
ncbi:site-2 protease family protein [candidate division KSB1 bacterium]|nr:site-2 protease family protein [bacterium]NUM66311.1 site-2 protease family protein [candidate division KSB1 bacterium]